MGEKVRLWNPRVFLSKQFVLGLLPRLDLVISSKSKHDSTLGGTF